MNSLPKVPALFFLRFIPSALLYLSCILILFYIDDYAHKTFLYQIGVKASPDVLLKLHSHLLDSILPIGVVLFIVMTALCFLFAISRRAQMASEITQQEQLYKIQLLLDSTQEGIYATDHEGNCTLANMACARLLGYDSPNVLLGKQMHDLMHHTKPDGSPYPSEECSAHKMSETGTVGVIENEIFWRRDGTSFPVSYSVLPMIDGKKAVGMVCTFTDITEKLQIEEELRQAQKMEAVGQLSGGIAHDFNNILQIVSNNTRLVMDNLQKESPDYNYMSEMLTAVDKGRNLTRSMLAFSRKQFMRIRPIELNSMLKDALVLGQKLVPKEITIEFKPCTAELCVEADSTLMQQVLFNLITNARDAMPRGGTITVVTQLVEPEPEMLALNRINHKGKFARMTVCDEGTGIPEEIRKNIFDPFFTTKQVGQGTGLGLSMVFGTVRQHGGIVNLLSSSENGSVIAVCLPISH